MRGRKGGREGGRDCLFLFYLLQVDAEGVPGGAERCKGTASAAQGDNVPHLEGEGGREGGMEGGREGGREGEIEKQCNERGWKAENEIRSISGMTQRMPHTRHVCVRSEGGREGGREGKEQ